MKNESEKLNLNDEELDKLEAELLPTQALRETLEMSERGNPKQTIGNVVRILKEDPFLADAIKWNEMTEKIDIVRNLGWYRDDDALNDTDKNNLIYYLEKNYGISYQSVIEKGIDIVANEHRYHPLREILMSLKWDGIPRVENALTRFLGVEKTELTTEALKLFMFGAVARLFEPGIKFETTICLVGDQGAGKSTFFRLMAIKDECFTDDLKKIDDENIFRKIQGHWIIEMSEMLATLNARSVEDIKSFLSRQKDTYKTPYDKHPRDRKRQCVFAGSSNRIEVLPMDKSGNRRIIPIEIHIDRAEVHILENEAESREYFLQMWAEIMELYRSGNYFLTLPKHLAAELAKYQARYTPEDTDAELIEQFLDETKEKYVCVAMLMREALGYTEYDRPKKNELNRVAETMRTMKGWEAVGQQRFARYGRQRAWMRVDDGNTVSEDGFEPVSEQLELPFTER